MNYHQPDPSWASIYRIKDFEEYEKLFIVKAKFHPLVPEEITKSFMLCEHISAQAYYHYPLYDEAASKALRITELAVKLRCKQLNIELQSGRINKKTSQPEKKSLSTLMNELSAKEKAKQLDWQLDISRRLRNSFMHPNDYSFSGVITLGFMKRTVNLFNKLFLPEQIFIDQEAKQKEVQMLFDKFANGMIIWKGDTGHPVHPIEVTGAVKVQGQWLLSLHAPPMPQDIVERMKSHSYHYPVQYLVTDIQITPDGLAMTLFETGEVLQVTDAGDLCRPIIETFCRQRDIAEKVDRSIYDHHYADEAAKQRNELMYAHLQQSEPAESSCNTYS
jgi:hypothetical protein